MMKLMSEQLQTSQTLAKEPSLEENPVAWFPVKEGADLPSSVTEDIRGVSLCPHYSVAQHRRIRRLGNKSNYTDNNSGSRMRRKKSRDVHRMVLRNTLHEDW
jgi:hypothetical protein